MDNAHIEQVQRLIDTYSGAVSRAVAGRFTMAEHVEFNHVLSLVRQGIEQAWEAGFSAGCRGRQEGS